MSFNPNTFGKSGAFTGADPCEGGRFIHVPIRRLALAATAAKAVAFSDTIDLTAFTNGNPAPYVSGIQTLIVYQNSKNTDGTLSDAAFLIEFTFNNGFKCFTPGKAYTALSVVADNSPVVGIAVYTMTDIEVGAPIDIDIYFGNAAMDQIAIEVK